MSQDLYGELVGMVKSGKVQDPRFRAMLWKLSGEGKVPIPWEAMTPEDTVLFGKSKNGSWIDHAIRIAADPKRATDLDRQWLQVLADKKITSGTRWGQLAMDKAAMEAGIVSQRQPAKTDPRDAAPGLKAPGEILMSAVIPKSDRAARKKASSNPNANISRLRGVSAPDALGGIARAASENAALQNQYDVNSPGYWGGFGAHMGGGAARGIQTVWDAAMPGIGVNPEGSMLIDQALNPDTPTGVVGGAANAASSWNGILALLSAEAGAAAVGAGASAGIPLAIRAQKIASHPATQLAIGAAFGGPQFVGGAKQLLDTAVPARMENRAMTQEEADKAWAGVANEALGIGGVVLPFLLSKGIGHVQRGRDANIAASARSADSTLNDILQGKFAPTAPAPHEVISSRASDLAKKTGVSFSQALGEVVKSAREQVAAAPKYVPGTEWSPGSVTPEPAGFRQKARAMADRVTGATDGNTASAAQAALDRAHGRVYTDRLQADIKAGEAMLAGAVNEHVANNPGVDPADINTITRAIKVKLVSMTEALYKGKTSGDRSAMLDQLVALKRAAREKGIVFRDEDINAAAWAKLDADAEAASRASQRAEANSDPDPSTIPLPDEPVRQEVTPNYVAPHPVRDPSAVHPVQGAFSHPEHPAGTFILNGKHYDVRTGAPVTSHQQPVPITDHDVYRPNTLYVDALGETGIPVHKLANGSYIDTRDGSVISKGAVARVRLKPDAASTPPSVPAAGRTPSGPSVPKSHAVYASPTHSVGGKDAVEIGGKLYDAYSGRELAGDASPHASGNTDPGPGYYITVKGRGEVLAHRLAGGSWIDAETGARIPSTSVSGKVVPRKPGINPSPAPADTVAETGASYDAEPLPEPPGEPYPIADSGPVPPPVVDSPHSDPPAEEPVRVASPFDKSLPETSAREMPPPPRKKGILERAREAVGLPHNRPVAGAEGTEVQPDVVMRTNAQDYDLRHSTQPVTSYAGVRGFMEQIAGDAGKVAGEQLRRIDAAHQQRSRRWSAEAEDIFSQVYKSRFLKGNRASKVEQFANIIEQDRASRDVPADLTEAVSRWDKLMDEVGKFMPSEGKRLGLPEDMFAPPVEDIGYWPRVRPGRWRVRSYAAGTTPENAPGLVGIGESMQDASKLAADWQRKWIADNPGKKLPRVWIDEQPPIPNQLGVSEQQQLERVKMHGSMEDRVGSDAPYQKTRDAVLRHLEGVSRWSRDTESNFVIENHAADYDMTHPGYASAMRKYRDRLWGLPTFDERAFGALLNAKLSPFRRYTKNPDRVLKTIGGWLRNATNMVSINYNPGTTLLNYMQPASTLKAAAGKRDYAAAFKAFSAEAPRLKALGVFGGDTKLGADSTYVTDPKWYQINMRASNKNRGIGYLVGEMKWDQMPEADKLAFINRSGVPDLPGGRVDMATGKDLMARQWMERTEFDNANTNKPLLIHGTMADMIGQYRGFQMKMFASLAADAHPMPTDKSRFDPLKRVLTSMAPMAAGGGARGAIPVVGTLAAPYIYVVIRDAIEDHGGSKEWADKIGTAIAWGPMYSVGIDFSGKASIAEPTQGATMYEQAGRIAFGAALSKLGDFSTGMYNTFRKAGEGPDAGYYDRLKEGGWDVVTRLATQLKGVRKVADIATKGPDRARFDKARVGSSVEVIHGANAFIDAALMGAGLRPAYLSEAYNKSAEKDIEKSIRRRRSSGATGQVSVPPGQSPRRPY